MEVSCPRKFYVPSFYIASDRGIVWVVMGTISDQNCFVCVRAGAHVKERFWIIHIVVWNPWNSFKIRSFESFKIGTSRNIRLYSETCRVHGMNNWQDANTRAAKSPIFSETFESSFFFRETVWKLIFYTTQNFSHSVIFTNRDVKSCLLN